jgi:sugar phosphate isomerase/epimerase
MYLGLLTAPFADHRDLAAIVRWAGANGVQGLEVASHHLDPKAILRDDGEALRQLLKESRVRISSFACYDAFADNLGPALERRIRELLPVAEALGVDTICTFVGFPEPGKSKLQTIRESAPRVFVPLAAEAAKHNVRLAFENWFATNLQHLDHFQAVMDVIDAANVGFNFDPSHLYWQGIDPVQAVELLGPRIFHTHAKDVLIRLDRRARLGVLDNGWWQYVIPGYGDLPWGRYIHALRAAGFDGVLSIEHEDAAFGPEEGFRRGVRFLSQFVV